jgi:hypothetical protein
MFEFVGGKPRPSHTVNFVVVDWRESYPVEPNQDPLQAVQGSFALTLTWEQASRIAERLGFSVSELVRSGMAKMMQEKHPAVPEDLVRLFHDIL